MTTYPRVVIEYHYPDRNQHLRLVETQPEEIMVEKRMRNMMGETYWEPLDMSPILADNITGVMTEAFRALLREFKELEWRMEGLQK